MENRILSDNLKKSKKEIYDLKYLLIVNQEFSAIEGKELMVKELKETQFFLQEILIDYENFLKRLEGNSDKVFIQNEGVLFKDERIQIEFKNSLNKINNNNPIVSVKLKISNISYIFIQNLKISFGSKFFCFLGKFKFFKKDVEIMQVFPEIQDVTLLQNQHVNQNISLPYKISLFAPLNFTIFYQFTLLDFNFLSTKLNKFMSFFFIIFPNFS